MILRSDHILALTLNNAFQSADPAKPTKRWSEMTAEERAPWVRAANFVRSFVGSGNVTGNATIVNRTVASLQSQSLLPETGGPETLIAVAAAIQMLPLLFDDIQ